MGDGSRTRSVYGERLICGWRICHCRMHKNESNGNLALRCDSKISIESWFTLFYSFVCGENAATEYNVHTHQRIRILLFGRRCIEHRASKTNSFQLLRIYLQTCSKSSAASSVTATWSHREIMRIDRFAFNLVPFIATMLYARCQVMQRFTTICIVNWRLGCRFDLKPQNKHEIYVNIERRINEGPTSSPDRIIPWILLFSICYLHALNTVGSVAPP